MMFDIVESDGMTDHLFVLGGGEWEDVVSWGDLVGDSVIELELEGSLGRWRQHKRRDCFREPKHALLIFVVNRIILSCCGGVI